MENSLSKQDGESIYDNAGQYMQRIKKQFDISKRDLQLQSIKSISAHDEEEDETGVGIKSLNNVKEVLPVQLSWINLNYIVKQGDKKKERQILSNISGSVHAGRVLAIMGPSGCGKSTLLNALSGRLPVGGYIEGQIQVNGVPITEGFRTLSTYVTQDDTLYATLTVGETLSVAASLRTPSSIGKAGKKSIVDSIIQELGLKKTENTFVGNAFIRGVSGGERKRVNIGVEMIANPSVLFLDEPTSGLDSFQAQSVVQTMWNLARNNRTIISVIHQPRSTIYKMFDQLLLLSAGHTVFYGKAQEAQDYFDHLGFKCPETYNPPDFFLDIVSIDTRTKEAMDESSQRVQLLIECYYTYDKDRRQSHRDISNRRITDSSIINFETQQFDPALQTRTKQHLDQKVNRNTNVFAQFCILYWRQATLSTRELTGYLITCAQWMVITLILGLSYLRIAQNKDQTKILDAANAMLFYDLLTFFSLLSNVLFIFPGSRKLMDKERASKTYKLTPYLVAVSCFEIPFRSLPPIVMGLLLYAFFQLERSASKFFYFVAITAIYVSTCCSYGFAISCAFTNMETANNISTPMIYIFTAFAGAYIAEATYPRGGAWVKFISPMRFGWYGYTFNEFEGQTGYSCAHPIQSSGSCNTCYTTGDEYLKSTGIFYTGNQFKTTERGSNMLGLVYLFISYNIFLYVILRFICKPRFAPLVDVNKKNKKIEARKQYANKFSLKK